ncbi:hypothetical protein P4U44_20070 [Alkalihalobacillus alcalophilus]|nr:hypothetical protein [Alkalihalobacillus alcalophilus]
MGTERTCQPISLPTEVSLMDQAIPVDSYGSGCGVSQVEGSYT